MACGKTEKRIGTADETEKRIGTGDETEKRIKEQVFSSRR